MCFSVLNENRVLPFSRSSRPVAIACCVSGVAQKSKDERLAERYFSHVFLKDVGNAD